jgi:hypothetical protein
MKHVAVEIVLLVHDREILGGSYNLLRGNFGHSKHPYYLLHLLRKDPFSIVRILVKVSRKLVCSVFPRNYCPDK